MLSLSLPTDMVVSEREKQIKAQKKAAQSLSLQITRANPVDPVAVKAQQLQAGGTAGQKLAEHRKWE
jgi:hypothetical protein